MLHEISTPSSYSTISMNGISLVIPEYSKLRALQNILL